MERKVKVTGFYLKPHVESRLIERKLQHLFLRVGQVERVSLSVDRNSAFVQFYQEDALSYVCEQEWRLCGELLKVQPVVPRSEPQPDREQQFQEEVTEQPQNAHGIPKYMYSFASYFNSRNKFWADVPHETFCVVSCAKKKKRNRCNGTLLHGPPSDHKQKHRQKKKKPKKKQKKVQLESFASLPFGMANILDEKPMASICKEEQHQGPTVREVFVKGAATVATTVPWTATAAAVREMVSAASKVPSDLLHITLNGRTLTDDAVLSMPEGSTLHYSVRGKGGMKKAHSAAPKRQESGEKKTAPEEMEENFQRLKDLGNGHVKREEHEEAVRCYTQCLNIRSDQWAIYTNRALCYLKLGKAVEAENDCCKALKLDPKNVKAFYRRGLARKMQERYKESMEDHLAVLRFEPENIQAKTEVEILKKLYKNEFDQSKDMQKTDSREDDPDAKENPLLENASDLPLRASAFNSMCSRKLEKTASEEECATWLQQVCGLQESKVKRNDNVDGDTLFEYKVCDLMKDYGLSLGCARKVIYLRDNPASESQMLAWCVEDVMQFIQSFDKTKQDLTHLKTQEIDGAALLSYQNRDEIEHELGLPGPLAMKIIAKRNKLMAGEQAQSSILGGNTETPDIRRDIAEIPENSSSAHKLFVQKVLSLWPLKHPVPNHDHDLVKCDLKIIYHKQKNLNKLEKSFLFLVLCKPEFSELGPQNQFHVTNLFNSLTSNVCNWMKFLPCDVREAFVVDSEKNQVYCEGQEIAFKLPNKSKPKLAALREKRVEDLESVICPILFVDRNLLQDQCKGYYFNMGTRNKPEYFYFGFDLEKKYCFFDSQNIGSFSEGKIAESQAGTHKQCMLVLVEPNRRQESTEPRSEGGAEGIQRQDSNQEELGLSILADGLVPEPSQEEQKPHVTPRGFKDLDVGVYQTGILDTFETAHNMVDPPSREFKLHDCDDATAPNAKRAFLLKSLRFVCGCLNSRRNGTIYFGVADKNYKCYKHGEIVGVPMTTEEQSEYCKLLREHLGKAFPGQENIVPECVSGPTFVHVKGSSPRKCVIEVDVEPRAILTEYKIFKFDASVVYESLGEPPKKEKQKYKNGTFLRKIDEGTGEPATLSLDQQGEKDFLYQDLVLLVKQREHEEEDSGMKKKRNIAMKEKQKFKTFIAQLDSSRFPILFVSKPTDALRENIDRCLSFVPCIRWAAIFDFDNDSDKDGLYRLCEKSSSNPNEFMEVPVTEFVYKPVHERREELRFPVKTLYIFANGKSSGEKTFDSLGPKEWRNQYFPFVRTANNFFQDQSVINCQRRLLLVYISEEAGEEMVKTCEDMKYAFGWENIFIIFEKEHMQSKFREDLSDDLLIEHSAVLSWRDAQCVIEEVLEFQKKDSSKFVCTASGALVELPSELWRSWEQDMEVLSAKECEEFKLTSDDQQLQVSESEEKSFYRGGKVSWLNFYFPGHVIKRTLLTDLKERVSDLCKKVGNKEAARVIVGHMPGTGGTTMVKHLLWKSRKHYKCAVVKKITPDTERHICEFWDACECEDKDQRNPVILVVDNVSNDDDEIDDFELCRRLHRLQKTSNLLKPLAVVIICQRNVKSIGDFFLTQDTDEREKKKLREIQKRLEGNDRLVGEMQTFLGFLSLRHGFDRKILQKIILPYINSETLVENERALICYIALVMVYFPSSLESPGIPVISCDKLMSTIEGMQMQTAWEKRLSKVAKYLLVIDDSNDFRHKIARISTYACAEVILKTVTQSCSLGDFVMGFLNSDLLTEQSGTSYMTRRIVIKVLIERQKTEDQSNITHMSPLIMAIQDDSFEKAVEVLTLGEQKLKDVMFYQQLARLYLKKGHINEAEENAKLAVSLSPESGEYKHTLGLVYMKILEDAHQLRSSALNSLNEMHVNNLTCGFQSLSNFVLAQKGDDAITVSYAFCDAVKVINLILSYMCKHVLRPEQRYDFGSFLTQSDFYPSEFEELKALEKDFKDLLSKAQASLKFLFYLGYSYRNKRGRDSLRQARSQFAISYAKTKSTSESRKLAETLKELVHKPNFTESTSFNAFRIENLKNGGTFFESIMYWVVLHNKPGTSDQSKRDSWAELEMIRSNLVCIPQDSMSSEDLDNYISVCLALQLIRIRRFFTSEESDLYSFCGTLLNCNDGILRMRAHVYRTLVSWPRTGTRVFNAEEFKKSFGARGSFLKSKNEPLSPRVHFFIARSTADFHICHWTEIYHNEEDEGSITTTMHQRLEPFKGTVIPNERNRPAVQLDFSCHTDQFPQGLKVRALRNENMLCGPKVKCYLGFSLQGPVAYIYESEIE